MRRTRMVVLLIIPVILIGGLMGLYRLGDSYTKSGIGNADLSFPLKMLAGVIGFLHETSILPNQEWDLSRMATDLTRVDKSTATADWLALFAPSLREQPGFDRKADAWRALLTEQKVEVLGGYTNSEDIEWENGRQRILWTDTLALRIGQDNYYVRIEKCARDTIHHPGNEGILMLCAVKYDSTGEARLFTGDAYFRVVSVMPVFSEIESDQEGIYFFDITGE